MKKTNLDNSVFNDEIFNFMKLNLVIVVYMQLPCIVISIHQIMQFQAFCKLLEKIQCNSIKKKKIIEKSREKLEHEMI